jgi:hypothetical protein
MLTFISEDTFEAHNPMFRVIVHEHPRRFGLLQLPDAPYPLTLCWRSTLVDPVILFNHHSSSIWIGVDQRVVCISRQGTTLFALGLDSPLITISDFAAYVIVLCETHAYAINADYSLRAITDLREIPDGIEMQDGQVIVTFIDGAVEVLHI